MKTRPAILLLCALCCPNPRLQAQVNLAPNPSFEEHILCPDGENQVDRCLYWWSASPPSITPDYLHECSPNGFAPPNPWGLGYQIPVTGVAYCHIGCYAKPFANYREYIQTQLTTPMVPGQAYYVSFYASRTGDNGGQITYATNKIGALFTTYKFQSPDFAAPNNFAQVYTDSILADTVNWFHFKESFVADSAYQYLTIGNFFDDAHTDTIDVGNGGFFAFGSSYYIDDVCVSTDSSLCFTPSYVQEEVDKQTISVYPNPANDHIAIKHPNPTIMELKLLNSLGQCIRAINIHKNIETRIDCTTWPNGVYFLKTENFAHKIIILH